MYGVRACCRRPNPVGQGFEGVDPCSRGCLFPRLIPIHAFLLDRWRFAVIRLLDLLYTYAVAEQHQLSLDDVISRLDALRILDYLATADVLVDEIRDVMTGPLAVLGRDQLVAHLLAQIPDLSRFLH